MGGPVDADLDCIERPIVDRGGPAPHVELARRGDAPFVDPAPCTLAKRGEPAEVAVPPRRHDVEILLVREAAPDPEIRVIDPARPSDRAADERVADESRPVRVGVELRVLAARDEMNA